MPASQQPASETAAHGPLSAWSRWHRLWDGSLRFRWLALGLMPLLLAFPIVIAVLGTLGGNRANALLMSNARSHLAGSENYLEQLRTNTGVRLKQLVQSEQLAQLLAPTASRQELNQVLGTAARGGGLDFLIVARTDGTIIASSTSATPGERLPHSHVISQAVVGITSTAYELFTPEQLATLSPDFPQQARVRPLGAPEGSPAIESRGLMITGAAHFPLTVNRTDAILVGGTLLNNNAPLIGHMRQIIFPMGSLPGDSEGLASIFIGDVRIATSRLRQRGEQSLGTRVESDVTDAVLIRGETLEDIRTHLGSTYVTAYSALSNGAGERIGMIGVGFPYNPYRQTLGTLLAVVTGLLALVMLALSLLFLHAGQELTQRLTAIRNTMSAVLQGQRGARVGAPLRDDELGALTRNFDELLETLERQADQQLAIQQTIAEEASRRRALFEHERDGVMILNPDGSVFEANPRCAQLQGYPMAELLQLRVSDWDLHTPPEAIVQHLESVGAKGRFLQTLLRRKDGSVFTCELALSRAEWSGKTFILALLRDITERKMVEAELDTYRQQLEALVEQRTRELQERSAQIDTIFTLSPDGFVSFDQDRKVAFANPAFQRLTGLPMSEIIGLDEDTFAAHLNRQCGECNRFPHVAALRRSRQQAASADAADHHRRHLFELVTPTWRVLAVRIRLSEAATVSQILYFRDVTHETEVDRMKSEFLSTAAHELRTPMANIYGYTELLRLREFSAEKRAEILTTISRQSERMSTIINELLDLARIEARRGKDFRIEHMALQDIVTETIAGFKPPEGRHSPVMPSAGPAIQVKVDRSKMQQVLLNILSNAYKYSPQGGDVLIRYRMEDSTDGAPRVGLEVQGHGIGMTEEQVARVCERFYRADTSGQIPGTGLGMSIVKEIIDLHGGDVEVHSQPGVDTTVCLWLPAA
jgi:PAS domain S-box-containing protein